MVSDRIVIQIRILSFIDDKNNNFLSFIDDKNASILSFIDDKYHFSTLFMMLLDFPLTSDGWFYPF